MICSREFVTDLSSLECPSAVKEQVLGLLQSWARVFSSDPALQGVVEVVAEMKGRGVTFPAATTQHIVLTTAQSSLHSSSSSGLFPLAGSRSCLSFSRKVLLESGLEARLSRGKLSLPSRFVFMLRSLSRRVRPRQELMSATISLNCLFQTGPEVLATDWVSRREFSSSTRQWRLLAGPAVEEDHH